MDVHCVPGAARRGWCNRCHTSTLWQWDVWAFTDDTMSAEPIATAEACERCDPHLFEGDDPGG